MHIQTESFFDFATFRAYFFNLLFKRLPARILRIVFVIEILLFVGYLITDLFINHRVDSEILFLGLVVIAISGSYFLILYIMAYYLYKKNKKAYLTRTVYLFEKDYFLVGLKGHNIQNGVKIEYKQVRQVEEVKRYFFLHLINKRTYVIRKDLFVRNTDDLRKGLIAYFGKNYYLKCK